MSDEERKEELDLSSPEVVIKHKSAVESVNMMSQSAPSLEPQPDARNELALPQSTNLPELLRYKSRLQELTQRSKLPLPVYQTIGEGAQHAPIFRSTVLVDGVQYTSPNTFSNRKAAEQDVARVALDHVTQKMRDDGWSIVREDTFFCKSILNEYTLKMNLEKPTYNTIKTEGLLPIFVSSLAFNGFNYTGKGARNKKEAEQLAARAVILSILGNSDSGTIMSEIIKSKCRLYVALHKVKGSPNAHDGIMTATVNTGAIIGISQSEGKELEVTGVAGNIPSNSCAINRPFHEFKKPRTELPSQTITPTMVFVPSAMDQPLSVCSRCGKS